MIVTPVSSPLTVVLDSLDCREVAAAKRLRIPQLNSTAAAEPGLYRAIVLFVKYNAQQKG